MDKKLSQEDIDPKIPFPPAQAPAGVAEPPTRRREIKVYDFRRPDKFSKDQIRTVQNMHESFARLTTTTLSAAMRAQAHCHVASVDQLTYEEFIRAIPTPCTLAVVDMDPLKGQALLEIDPSTTFSIIERLFGGSGGCALSGTNRELTDIEHSIMEGIIVRMLGNLREGWKYVVDLRPRLTRIETNPQFSQIVPPSEMVVLVTFETKTCGVEGMMNLCIPYLTIEPIVSMLTAEYWFSPRHRGLDPKTTKALFEHLADFVVAAEVYREGEKISLRDVGRLRRGSLVRIPRYERGEAFLRMGGRTLLRMEAQPPRRGKPQAYSITGGAKMEAAPDLESAELAPEISGTVAAIKDALLDLRSGMSEALSGISQGIGELQHRQAQMADQLAFGPSEPNEPEADKGPEHLKPFDSVRRADPEHLALLIQQEHPQTIALVLSYLEPQTASRILAGLPPDLQPEIIQRIATMGQTMPEVLHEVERILDKKLSVFSSDDYTPAGGIESVVDILNIASRGVERNVVESMERDAPELAEEIKRRMFVFEDITLLGPETARRILGRVDPDILLHAMKAIPEAVREFLWGCLPEAEVEGMKSGFERMGRIRLHDVEEAQQKVVTLIREMEESGEIVIERPGEAMA
jgi:flagellar motor switch protein FliM